MWSIGILILSRTIQDAFYRRHFRKRCLGELRRIPILRGWVNRSGQDSSSIHSGLLRCLVGKAIGDPRRTRVDPTIEDEAAARAGAAARATCDVGTLHGTYLFADNGVFAPTGQQFAGAGYEYYDGNGN